MLSSSKAAAPGTTSVGGGGGDVGQVGALEGATVALGGVNGVGGPNRGNRGKNKIVWIRSGAGRRFFAKLPYRSS